MLDIKRDHLLPHLTELGCTRCDDFRLVLLEPALSWASLTTLLKDDMASEELRSRSNLTDSCRKLQDCCGSPGEDDNLVHLVAFDSVGSTPTSSASSLSPAAEPTDLANLNFGLKANQTLRSYPSLPPPPLLPSHVLVSPEKDVDSDIESELLTAGEHARSFLYQQSS